MGKIDCEIIMDLLPGYVEKLTSERTNQAVEEHLESCENCREAYEQMTEEMHPLEGEKIPEPVRVLPFLKKMKNRAFFRGALLAACICLSLWGLAKAYRYVKYSVPVPGRAVSAESYLMEDGGIYVEIRVAEEYPVTHGWSWYEEDSSIIVHAQMDRVPLGWLYWIENHLPFNGGETDMNQKEMFIPADEAADMEIIFMGREGEAPVVLYNGDTELLPGTDREIQDQILYHHMVMEK